MNYKDYNDNELLSYVEESDESAKELLLKKYDPYIQHAALHLQNKSQYNSGLELSDLVQEGYVGLTKAISSYNQDKETSFFTYAKKCINNQMLSFAIQSTRKKHKVLNESISLEALLDERENLENILMRDDSETPEEQLISIETENRIMKELRDGLSNLESQIFDLKLSGLGYKDIAEFLEKDPKVIDNTLQRIKAKLKKVIQNQEKE